MILFFFIKKETSKDIIIFTLHNEMSKYKTNTLCYCVDKKIPFVYTKLTHKN